MRAVYEWIVDNDCTPFLVADVEAPNIVVPMEHAENGQIVLNISPSAVAGLQMDNDWVQFSARFGGVARQISVPVSAVLGIYAKENSQGMAFPDDSEYEDVLLEESDDNDPEPPKSPSGGGNGRAHLKVVK